MLLPPWAVEMTYVKKAIQLGWTERAEASSEPTLGPHQRRGAAPHAQHLASIMSATVHPIREAEAYHGHGAGDVVGAEGLLHLEPNVHPDHKHHHRPRNGNRRGDECLRPGVDGRKGSWVGHVGSERKG